MADIKRTSEIKIFLLNLSMLVRLKCKSNCRNNAKNRRLVRSPSACSGYACQSCGRWVYRSEKHTATKPILCSRL